MKPGLSLRTSQHLALTPQLQQSIRLLQLSTLELAGEVEQMLLDNPFLEREDEHADAEPVREPREREAADTRDAIDSEAFGVESTGAEAEFDSKQDWLDDWEGDGADAPSDREWGDGTAANPPGDEHNPGERGAPHESLSQHLHAQALALRLAPEDVAVLRFLIESLNEDGYLEDSLAQLAATLVDDGDELDALDTLVHRFNFALKLLQSMEPAGVGARDLPECLSLQLRARLADAALAPAAQACARAALALLAQPQALTRWPGATCAAWRRPAARTRPRCAPPWP